MAPSLQRTPLHGWHREHGARLVEFAGWEMPIQYTSIVEEHHATRQAVGLFDISHMARLFVTGDDAAAFLDYLVTNSVSKLAPGRIRYALVTNEQGGTRDDVLVYRLPEGWDHSHLVVANAANRTKILDWFAEQRSRRSVSWTDRTAETAMIAVQGPRAVELVAKLISPTDGTVQELRYYRSATCTVQGTQALVSRTGYTGEDGVELIVPARIAVPVWESLLAEGESLGARPCGLGARDTLRLEAGLPLYGHELAEDITPLEARLEFAVKLDKGDFVGRDALLKQKEQGLARVRVGLELEGRRIARQGAEIVSDDKSVGTVTSGTFAPTLQKVIAMGFVPPELAADGTPLTVVVRGHAVPARVVPLPFYRRSR